MELFSLLAKLTLDAKDFDKKINEAEQSARKLKIDEPVLGLDDSDFVTKMSSAQDESVDDMTGDNAPKLGLDDTDFDTKMTDAQGQDVDDMTGENAPELGLDDTEFDTNMTNAQAEDVADMTGDNAPKLGLDSEEFKTGVSEAQDSATTLGGSMTETFESVKKALIATGIVAAITSITNLITSAINKTTELADTIDKQSTTLGISKQKYQEWDHALKQSGGSVSELSRGAIKFRNILADTNTALADSNNEFALANLSTGEQVDKLKELGVLTEDQADAFKKLGISMIDTNGRVKTSEALMEEALLAVSELSGEEQLSVINELFGKNVTGIANLVAGGKEQVKELLGEAQELGLVMSDEEIANAVAYGDAVANLNSELEAIQTAFVQDILPVLKDAAEAVTKILAAFNPRNRDTKLDDAFESINKKAIASKTKIEETSTAAQAMIDKLAGMGDYWTLDTNGKKTWDALAKEFKDNYPQFADYIDDTNKKLTDNTNTIKANIREWEAREKAMILDTAMEQKRQAVAEKLNKAYEKNAEAESKEAEATAKRETAMQGLNDLLDKTDKKYEKMQSQFQKKFGTNDVTLENFAEAAKWLYENYKPFLQEQGISSTVSDWETLSAQATTLREEASGMMEDAEKAEASLTEQEEFLEKALFKTEENAKKAKSAIELVADALKNMPTSMPISFPWWNGASRAIGDAYIPYDNFPALLHRGERIVTATEARQERQGYDFTGLEDRIEAAIRNGMANARVNAYLNGKDITDEVNRNNIQAVRGRRFAT